MWWRRVLAGLGGLLLLIQLRPVDRSNPPVELEMPAPPEVRAILERACYDCHSNRTRWPWYAWVAPVSWRVAEHVREGRERLNFSTWNRYDAGKQRHRVNDVVEEVVEGEMPLPDYLRLHPEAALEPHEVAALRRWARSFRPVSADAPASE